MNNYFQKALGILLCFLCSIVANAHDFEVDGIYYNYTADNTAQVTYQGASSSAFVGEYTGDIVIPDNVYYAGTTMAVTSINEDAFYDCTGVTSIVVGNNVVTIGHHAFGKCTGLTSITLGKSVATIKGSIYKCDALSEIVSYATTPPTVGYIELRDQPIKAVYVPNDLYDLYKADANWGIKNVIRLEPEVDDTFYSNGLMYRVTNNGVVKFVALAYRGPNYEYDADTIVVPEQISIKSGNYYVCAVDDSAFYKQKITHITLPNTVNSIGNYSFYNTYLTEAQMPNSIYSIGDYAFANNPNMTAVNISSGVKFIGEYAFYNSNNISTIISMATTPPTIKSSSFYGLNQVPLIVPQGCKEAYQSASYWRSFANIYEGGESLPVGTKLEVDNIYYIVTNAENKSVEVTYKGSSPNSYHSPYIGTINIPDTITYGATVYNVTSIGENAFYNSYGLDILNIGSNISHISKYAFNNCDNLSMIVVDADNKVYDSRNGCNAVIKTATDTLVLGCKTTVIPTDISAIGEYAFVNGGESITIPANITYIGQNAFMKMTQLKNIYITDIAAWCNITFESSNANPFNQGDRLFVNGELLTELIIPDSVTRINNYAFYKYEGLTYLSLGNGVTSIGNYAFAYCNGLFDVTISANIAFIGNGAFYKCNGLKTIQYKAVNCADMETPHGVCYPFQQCDNLRTVVVGNDVKRIPSYLFSLSKISEVTMGDNVTEIGAYAFAQCESLSNIKLSNALTTIQYNAFAECTGLTTIVVPDNTTTIGSRAFYKCNGLYDVTIGSGVKDIYQSAFEGCTGLKNLTIVDSDSTLYIDAISYAAFGGPGQGMFSQAPLETIYLGRNVTYRTDGGYSPFYNRTELTSVTISDRVTDLPDNLFYKCSKINTLDIPASVTNISNTAFLHCTGLDSISVNIHNPNYDSRNNCNSLIHTSNSTLLLGSSNSVVPNDIKTIASNAFYGQRLTQVVIPDSVEVIGSSAFENCSDVTNLFIGNGIMNLGKYSFAGCTALASITCTAIEPPAAYEAFYNVDKSIPVYVAEESIEAYKAAAGWSDFTNYIALPKEGTVTTPVITTVGRIVTITCDTEHTTIYYTIDGSNPTIESNIYTEPIRVDSNCIVKAIAVRTNYYTSDIAVAEISSVINLAFAQEYVNVIYNGTCIEPELIISGNMDTDSAMEYVTVYKRIGEEEVVVGRSQLIDAGYYRLSIDTDNDSVYAHAESVIYIKKATLTIESCYATKKYGDENPALTYNIYGYVDGEDESVLLSNPTLTTSATTTSDVGEYPILAKGADATNYDFVYINGLLYIEKVELTITADDKTIEYGEELPEWTFTAEGFRCDDVIEDVDELPFITCEVTSSTLSGTYPIVLTGGNDNNYQLVLVNGTLTINEQPIVLAESITLNKELLNLSTYQCEQLEVIITPDNVTTTTVLWSSSDESVAEVDSYGNVAAVGKGETVITVSTVDGSNLSAQCFVVVEHADIDVVGNGNMHVATANGDVIVKDAPVGSVIYLYTTTGSLVYSVQATDNITRISLDTKGVYIVKVDNTTMKVVL